MRTCGARTKHRGGAPCRLKPVAGGGRCRFHGGHSTGPTTQEGRDRIAAAQRKRWNAWRAKNPRLFVGQVSASQERRIRKTFRQLQALKSEMERGPWQTEKLMRLGAQIE